MKSIEEEFINEKQQQKNDLENMADEDVDFSKNLRLWSMSRLKDYAREELGIRIYRHDTKRDLINKIVDVFDNLKPSDKIKNLNKDIFKEIRLVGLEKKYEEEKQKFLSNVQNLKKKDLLDMATNQYGLGPPIIKPTLSIPKIKEAILEKIKDDIGRENKGAGLKYGVIVRPIVKKYGNGLGDNKTLSITKPPKFKDFGYYNINYPRLIDKNVFNILYKSGSNHHLFPPIKISNEYRDFLKELIDDCRINDEKLSNLNEPESIHFNNVLIASGLSNKFKLKANNSEKIKEENNRFNILLGEIKAGNNNRQIIKELKSLIKKFMNDGRLNKNEAQQALNEIALSLM
jgi:hypothetical protein